MYVFRRSPLAVLPAVLALFACANPADDKPEATVGAAAPAAVTAVAGDLYLITDDSTIAFVGSKVTGSHDGGFREFSGEIQVADGDPERSHVEISIETPSLWSDNDKLTGHLKSADFLGVETHPTASFSSTSIVRDGDGFRVTGNLDLHGMTKSIAFPATIEVTEAAVTAQAEFFIQRFDFGIVYKGRADDLIRDEVVIRLDLRATRAD